MTSWIKQRSDATYCRLLIFRKVLLGFPFQNITKSSFRESFIKWIDIVDKKISIYIINIGAATPLPSFKEESDGGEGPTTKITEQWNEN